MRGRAPLPGRPVVFNLLSPRLHILAIALLAGIGARELCAGDGLEMLEWVPLSGPLPDMAFDEWIIERYQQTELEEALPVDPDFARQGHCILGGFAAGVGGNG